MIGASGRLIVISGPSGAGKSTLVRELLKVSTLPLEISVSATTRQPRNGEIDGVHYHFLSPERFASLRQQGAFLECKEVFGRGDWYGTLIEPVASGLQAGKWVLLEIDVEGAMAVFSQFPEAISIFIHPGTAEELERRLRGRNTESEASIQRRLEVARRELTCVDRYRHQIVNDSASRAIAEILQLLERYREHPPKAHITS